VTIGATRCQCAAFTQCTGIGEFLCLDHQNNQDEEEDPEIPPEVRRLMTICAVNRETMARLADENARVHRLQDEISRLQDENATLQRQNASLKQQQ
jgi:hypothetical protein